MPTNAVVRARIDEQVKEEAAAVLAEMGLTVSDAVRLMLTRVAREHALPFNPLIPNEETVAAMKEARRGNLETVTLDELQAVLDDNRHPHKAGLLNSIEAFIPVDPTTPALRATPP